MLSWCLGLCFIATWTPWTWIFLFCQKKRFCVTFCQSSHGTQSWTRSPFSAFFLVPPKISYVKSRPIFYVLNEQLGLSLSSLKIMVKKNVVKLCRWVEEVKLTDGPFLLLSRRGTRTGGDLLRHDHVTYWVPIVWGKTPKAVISNRKPQYNL